MWFYNSSASLLHLKQWEKVANQESIWNIMYSCLETTWPFIENRWRGICTCSVFVLGKKNSWTSENLPKMNWLVMVYNHPAKFLRHELLYLQKQTTVKKTIEIFNQHIDVSVKYCKHPSGILIFMRVSPPQKCFNQLRSWGNSNTAFKTNQQRPIVS
jgi:hypothetical protein